MSALIGYLVKEGSLKSSRMSHTHTNTHTHTHTVTHTAAEMKFPLTAAKFILNVWINLGVMMVTEQNTSRGWRKTNQSLPSVNMCRKARKRQRKEDSLEGGNGTKSL